MERVRWWRIGVILFVVLLSGVYVLPSVPSFYGPMYGHLPADLQGSQGIPKPVSVDGGFEFLLDKPASKSAEALSKAYRRLAATLRERSQAIGLTDVRLNDSATPADDSRAIQAKLKYEYTDFFGRSPDAVLRDLQLYGKLPLGLRGWLFPESRIQLGLDLKGGVYLALELDLAEAEQQVMAEAQSSIQRDLRDRYRVNCREVTPDQGALIVVVKPSADWGAAGDTRRTDTEKYLEGLESFSVQPVNGGAADAEGLVRYRLELKSSEMDDQTSHALTQVLEVLRNRIDAFGVAEPDIRQEPNKPRIIVQLPGARDSSTAANVVKTMGRLEFRMVQQKDGAPWYGSGTPPTPDQVPDTAEVLYDREGHWLVVDRESVITGRDISRATTQRNIAEIVVSVRFTGNGRRAFGEATAAHVNELMAIILDNTVVSFPRIREPILTGEASISGGFDQESAGDLARILRAGAFPVGVKVAEERTVGPSLGQEAIRKGTLAAIIGIATALVFMTYYYNICGTFAAIALVLNALMILASLALLGATLTLPGLAGLVLTMGMAVDANVLINERIKEELRAGKSVSA
ncbi:protein translocase subunit SecD, partial [Candidatus Poribacteria bacterium]|nr:protein translocase subunit SecD [Candidatus Poribacteria bacterium]